MCSRCPRSGAHLMRKSAMPNWTSTRRCYVGRQRASKCKIGAVTIVDIISDIRVTGGIDLVRRQRSLYSGFEEE